MASHPPTVSCATPTHRLGALAFSLGKLAHGSLEDAPLVIEVVAKPVVLVLVFVLVLEHLLELVPGVFDRTLLRLPLIRHCGALVARQALGKRIDGSPHQPRVGKVWALLALLDLDAALLRGPLQNGKEALCLLRDAGYALAPLVDQRARPCARPARAHDGQDAGHETSDVVLELHGPWLNRGDSEGRLEGHGESRCRRAHLRKQGREDVG